MGSARLIPTAALVVAPLMVLTACSDDASSSATSGTKATVVTVTISDDGCVPEPSSVESGPILFKVQNISATRVSEAEVVQSGRILGEKENLTPGLSGTFTLRLAPGDYAVQCPNAATDLSALTVTAAAGYDGPSTPDPSLTEAVTSYRAYLENQTASLTAATEKFTTAVHAGDIGTAKSLFAPARSFYERIEPVAETFGDLDPQIDARVNDVASTDEWTGFHRIEKALWADKSLKGMDIYATKLLVDVKDLQERVKTIDLAPEQIANGAVSLLDEVAKSKITGEEDRYSHTDLWDFAANVAGAREAVDVLSPTLKQKDATLLATINAQFADVLASLATYQVSGGYRDYSAVTDAERRQMTREVNALAESLSKVAPLIA